MTATYFDVIGTTTVQSGGAASINFTSIPQTYTDLLLLCSLRSAVSGTFSDNLIRFNSSLSDFSNKYIYANGTSTLAGSNAYSGSGGFITGAPGSTNTINTFSNTRIYIPSYASSSDVKYYLVDGAADVNNSLAYLHMLIGLWDNSSAITSISLVTDNATNYAQHSTATLYGIKNS